MKKENVVKLLTVLIILGSMFFLSKKLYDSTVDLSSSVAELSVKVENLGNKLNSLDNSLGAVQHQMFLNSLEESND